MPIIFGRHVVVSKKDGRTQLRFWNKTREACGATGKTMEIEEAIPNGRKVPTIEKVILYEHLFSNITPSSIKRSKQFAGWEITVGTATVTLTMRDFEYPLTEKGVVAIFGK